MFEIDHMPIGRRDLNRLAAVFEAGAHSPLLGGYGISMSDELDLILEFGPPATGLR